LKNVLAAWAVVAALVVVGGASADPVRYGVADDWPKFHPCGDVWWQSQADIGYQDLRLTVQWNEASPTDIPFQANIQAAIDCAKLANVRTILAVYPLHPTAIGSNVDAQAQFATFVSLVGQAFPDVTDFIVGNEPNVNRFWQPQYLRGEDAAAKDYEHTLAQSYDALKTVRPDATVWGPAVSSRGNDNANAVSNPSHSPVLFIKYMGDAYHASGRTTPIFDEFNFHPYPPIQDSDPFTKPFHWPQAGAANLDRIKQALWDAFNGTGQPVPAEQAGGRAAQSARFGGRGLPLNMDEAGEQTTTSGHDAAYTAAENIAPIDPAVQGQRDVDLSQAAACDPDVNAVLFFLIIDESDRGGFQSGNLYADQAKKQSYTDLKNEFASAQGTCHGTTAAWVHTTQVIGAAAIFGGPGTDPGSQPSNKPAGISQLQTAVTANEDATYVATLQSSSAGRRTVSARVAAVTGAVQAYHRPLIKFTGAIPNGTYTIQIALKAVTNPSRTSTLMSRPFTVGTTRVKATMSKPSKRNCKNGFHRSKKGACVRGK
jgi:hypothetical protein